jgi:hypothetical protein
VLVLVLAMPMMRCAARCAGRCLVGSVGAAHGTAGAAVAQPASCARMAAITAR